MVCELWVASVQGVAASGLAKAPVEPLDVLGVGALLHFDSALFSEFVPLEPAEHVIVSGYFLKIPVLVIFSLAFTYIFHRSKILFPGFLGHFSSVFIVSFHFSCSYFSCASYMCIHAFVFPAHSFL